MLVPLTPDDGVLLDLRYATPRNVTGRPIYRRPVAMLVPPARDRLRAAAARAARLGLALKVFDAFRPLEGQEALWAHSPDPRFTANPFDGSALHPRGVAVDLTLVDATGRELEMGTGFDDFSAASAHAALDLPADAIRHRALLLGLMAATGWEHIDSEWWHYQLPDARGLPQWRAAQVPDGPM